MIQHATEFSLDVGWRILLKDLGVSEVELLRRAELPGDLFTQSDPSLGTDDFFRLWQALEADQGNATFPLRIARMISTEAFHPLFFAVLCSPNMRVGMTRISHFKRLVGPMRLDVEEDRGGLTITIDCLNTDRPLPEALAAAELVFLVRLVRMATREELRPAAVRSPARVFQSAEYTDYFGVRATRSKLHQLKFSAADATRPFLTENTGMWQFFEPELRRRLSELQVEADVPSRVQGALLELLPGGLSSIEDVARTLNVSKRTLQRELSQAGTTFQKELNHVRERLARHYLTNSDLPGEQISFLLGFEDPNSFARAFRAWTGETPGSVRRLVNS